MRQTLESEKVAETGVRNAGLKQLAQQVVDKHATPEIATRRVMLGAFREALQVGRLHQCEKCSAFTPRPETLPDGWCRTHETETWKAVPFHCARYAPRARPAWLDDLPVATCKCQAVRDGDAASDGART